MLEKGNAEIGYTSMEMLKAFTLLKSVENSWIKYLDGDMMDDAPTRQLDRDELRKLPFANIEGHVPDDLHAALDNVSISQKDIDDLVLECICNAYYVKAESVAEMQEQAKVWGITFPDDGRQTRNDALEMDDPWEL